MPIHPYGIHGRHERDDLVRRLVWELQKQTPMPGESADLQPDIYIEEVGREGQLHVHVVWFMWGGVPEMHRSGIILDAFREALPDKAGKIAIAMGLTPDESAALGLEGGSSSSSGQG